MLQWRVLYLDALFLTSVLRYLVIYPHHLFYLTPSLHSLTTESALIVPGYSAIIRWMGSIAATNKKLRDALNIGSCAVVVDGIAGMYVDEPDKEMA